MRRAVPCPDQLLDLGLGQVLALSIIGVGTPTRPQLLAFRRLAPRGRDAISPAFAGSLTRVTARITSQKRAVRQALVVPLAGSGAVGSTRDMSPWSISRRSLIHMAATSSIAISSSWPTSGVSWFRGSTRPVRAVSQVPRARGHSHVPPDSRTARGARRRASWPRGRPAVSR